MASGRRGRAVRVAVPRLSDASHLRTFKNRRLESPRLFISPSSRRLSTPRLLSKRSIWRFPTPRFSSKRSFWRFPTPRFLSKTAFWRFRTRGEMLKQVQHDIWRHLLFIPPFWKSQFNTYVPQVKKRGYLYSRLYRRFFERL